MPFEQITRLGMVNCYLVDEGESLTLIDTAIPRSEGAIVEAAERLGKPIATIVVTHAHVDHVGSLDALVERLPDAQLVASRREARLLRGDREPDPDEAEGKLRGAYRTVGATIHREVEPGETVGPLEVVGASGHTPGQIALLDPRDRTLFCADAYTTIGGVASTGELHWRFPFPYLASWNRELGGRTARALADLAPRRLAPGHGKVVDGAAEQMREAVG